MAVKKLASVGFCAGIFLNLAFAQPLGNGVISGKVVDGESGDPIRKAVVTLTLQGTPRRWATERTDGSGVFRFEGLPAAKYELRAVKASEGAASYGVNHLRELGDLITLRDGETRGGITLRFLRSASISGHVYDSDGDPVAGAVVNLLRQGRNFGAPILVNYRGANTDDRGEYRIDNIDPGQYYLRAMPQNQGMRMGSPNPDSKMLVTQYFGGARDSKDASPIHVGGGEQLSSVDFRMTLEPAVELRGRVLGLPEEPESQQTPATRPGRRFVSNGPLSQEGGVVTISPAESGMGQWGQSIAASGPERLFQLGQLAAGSYRIGAVFHSAGKAYGASQLVDLHPGMGEIQLALAPAIDIHGTLRVEGQSRAEGTPAGRGAGNGIRIQLARPGTMQGSISVQVGADGRFTLEQVLPGEWQLGVNPVPPGFLKAAQLGDKDVRFVNFEVGSSPDAVLNIVVSMNTATVEGDVDAGSSDPKRSGIVLAPVGPYHNLARFYYGIATDDKGKFKVAGLAPGKYKIFALERMAVQSFRTPEAADQLDQLGEVLDLAEGATVEAHPKLIPAERAAKALE